MIHVKNRQISLKRCYLQWIAKFHCHHPCKGHTARLLSRYWDSSMVCPWEALAVQGSLSVIFSSILNLCVALTDHSRFKCTCLWNTFLIIPFLCYHHLIYIDIFFWHIQNDGLLFIFRPFSSSLNSMGAKDHILFIFIFPVPSPVSVSISVCYSNRMFNWRKSPIYKR